MITTGFFFGHDHMCVVLQDVRGNTNIKMEQNMSRGHEQTRRVFIRSLGRRIQSTNGRTTMMRASGRSIPRKCDVWEHDFQSS